MRFLASLGLLAALFVSPALAQPQPPPSPWVQSGNQISYGGCITVPVSVAGGCQGNGSLNLGSIFINGVAPPTAVGTGLSLSSGTLSLTLPYSGAVPTSLMTGSGSFVDGNCAQFSGGNIVDSGAPCGGGGGSGTVSAGLANQLGRYASNGTTISGLATASNGVLVTSAGAVPSISSTLPAAVQGNITALGTIGTGVWQGTLLATTYGGSGLSNPTAHSILQAEGSSAFGLITAATAGHIIVDQGSGADWTSVAVNGDGTLTNTGALTVTKTNGSAFGTFATQNFATPPAIGGVTPAAGTFTTLQANTSMKLAAITGSTQCLQVDTTGLISGAGTGCGASGTNPVVGGRLVAAASSCSGTPAIQYTNIAAAASVCYVPFLNGLGNLLWINGVNYTYSLLTEALNSAHQLISNLYDIFAVVSSGNAVLCAGANAWSSISVSPARTDAISQNANGIWQNSGTLAHCWNGTTDHAGTTAGNATYLGTIYASAAGQTTWVPTPAPVAGGPTGGAIVGVYNAYNQVITNAFMGDKEPPASGYQFFGVSQWQNFGASLNERISYVDGLGTSGANFYFKSDWSGQTSSENGGGTSLCVDGSGNAPSAPTCQNGGPGTDFAPTSTSWETDNQVGMTGSQTTTMIAISQHWITMIGFHYVQALWVTASGQHVLVACGNNGAICQMHAQIPM
jgi:hypothetical protein